MLENLGVGVVGYLIVMIAWIIPGFFDLNWNLFKSEKRNKAMLKWYMIIGNIVALGIAICVVIYT